MFYNNKTIKAGVLRKLLKTLVCMINTHYWKLDPESFYNRDSAMLENIINMIHSDDDCDYMFSYTSNRENRYIVLSTSQASNKNIVIYDSDINHKKLSINYCSY